jgi:hypothetical protein
MTALSRSASFGTGEDSEYPDDATNDNDATDVSRPDDGDENPAPDPEPKPEQAKPEPEPETSKAERRH